MPKIPFPNGVLDIKRVRILKTTPLEDGEKYTIALGCDQNLDYTAQLLPDILIKSVKKNGVNIPFYEAGGQQPNTVIADGDIIEFTACYGEPEPPPISIASHMPTDGFVAGVVKRITITVNSHEFLTTTWDLTMSNATFSIVSSTTSQLVVDVTATAAGSVIVTDLVNNGYSITNKPYNLGTATVQLHKGNWDGINDYLAYVASVNAALAATNKFTFEYTIKFKAAPSTSQFMSFASSLDTGFDVEATFYIFWENRSGVNINSRKFRLALNTTSNVTYGFSSGFVPSINTDYRIAHVFDGSTNKLRMYVNGALVSEETTTGVLRASTQPLYIGRGGTFNIGSFGETLLNAEVQDMFLHKAVRYSGASYDHTQPAINDNDTLIVFQPIVKTNNVVDNTAVGGTTIGNGTLSGVTNYPDFYKTR